MDVRAHLFHIPAAEHADHRPGAGVVYSDLDHFLFKFAAFEAFLPPFVACRRRLRFVCRFGLRFFAGILEEHLERILRLRRFRLRQEAVDDAFVRKFFCLLCHGVHFVYLHHADRSLDQVADHRFDIAADIADLGELRCFDLDERRIDELRQASGDLGLPDAGRSDHKDILRYDLFFQFFAELLAAPAIAESNGNGLLRLCLPYNIMIKFLNDLSRCQFAQSDSPVLIAVRL